MAAPTIHAGDQIWFFGNSITNNIRNEGGYPWPSAPGALIAQMQALVAPAAHAAPVTVTGAMAKSTGASATVIPIPGTIIATTFGVDGDTMSQIAAYLPAQIAAIPTTIPSPVFVIEGGTNDATAAGCTAGATSIVSQLQAVWPNCRIIFMAAMTATEAWVNVPPPAWPSNQYDLNNAATAAVAATATNGAFVDTRAALLAWEVINNPTMVGSGVGTVDGIHPKIVVMVNVMAPAFLAVVPVGP